MCSLAIALHSLFWLFVVFGLSVLLILVGSVCAVAKHECLHCCKVALGHGGGLKLCQTHSAVPLIVMGGHSIVFG